MDSVLPRALYDTPEIVMYRGGGSDVKDELPAVVLEVVEVVDETFWPLLAPVANDEALELTDDALPRVVLEELEIVEDNDMIDKIEALDGVDVLEIVDVVEEVVVLEDVVTLDEITMLKDELLVVEMV